MHPLQIGPLLLSPTPLLFAVAIGAAMLVGHGVARSRRVALGERLTWLVIAGVVAARATFVLRYLPAYGLQPWSALDPRDGGFDLPAGALAAVLCAVWMGWKRAGTRVPIAAALAAGAIGWGAIDVAGLLQNAPHPSRPDVAVVKLDGQSIRLAALASSGPGGAKPMVVNLWASWCPPCRSELPALVRAQHRDPRVAFVFVNEGESLATVRRFLHAESLSPSNVVLDRDQALARAMNVRGFPTTLFFGSNGRLVELHTGMLSEATLARSLRRLFASERNASDG